MTLWKNLFPWVDRSASEAAPAAEETGAAPEHIGSENLHPACLVLPHEPDPFGKTAPALTREAVQLSLALAEMTYTLDITPWLAAGWQDFSFQIDDVLESSGVSTPQDGAFQQLASLSRMRRAQHALRARNPLTQLVAAVRQRDGSDTVKAVCMAYPLPEGRTMIAIGFMGTGKRFYDWFSNFRLGNEGGFHQGFYQLASRFETEAERIFFPQTAQRLGLGSLSLMDVIHDMRSPDSRFRLWMAGHSQGGAVMQVFTHRLMHDYGVQRRLICGYGFASPTAAAGELTSRPWEAPLWHIQNRDDLVPRLGAQMHLGRCVEWVPDESARRTAYRFSTLAADENCRRWLSPLLYRIRDTADNLMHVTALILVLAEEKGEGVLNHLWEGNRWLPLPDRLHALAGDRAQSVTRQLEAHLRRMYEEVTGHPMDEQRLRALKEELRPHVAATPLRRLFAALTACLAQPHLLNDDDGNSPKAYGLLVQCGLNCLRPYRWTLRPGSEVPVRQVGDAVGVSGMGHGHCAGMRTAGRPKHIRRGKARLMQRAERGGRR